MRWSSQCIGKGMAGMVVMVSLGAAWGGERERSGKTETSGGRTAGFEQEIDRGKGFKDRSTTVQTQGGNWNRNVQDHWNRGAGAANRAVVTTAPNGKTATVQQTAVRNGNSVDVNSRRTGYDGKTSDWNQTLTRTGSGTVVGQGQYTRQNGNTIDTQSTTLRTTDGHVTTGKYTTSTGKSGTFSDQVVNHDRSRVKTESITSSAGRSADRVVDTNRSGNGIDRTVTTTGPNGNSETHTETVTLDK